MPRAKPPEGLPPKPTKKKRYPVSSFGPELMAVLLKGATESFTLKFPNNNKATFFQHRIHTLRAAMRNEGHELAEAVSRTRFKRVWGPRLAAHLGSEAGKPFENDHKGEKGSYILVQPADSEFKDVLDEAGVKVEAPKIDTADLPAAAAAELLGVEIQENTPAFFDPYADYKGGEEP